MNALFILIIAIIAFLFGYRFYAKLLALAVFRLQSEYSTPAHSQADDHHYAAADAPVLFGHHVAALSVVASITGGILALMWGWIPAFLWLVVATTVAGAVYGLGCLWMCVRTPMAPLHELAGRYIGPATSAVFWVTAAAVVLILNAASLYICADLLASNPDATVPFWLFVVIALVFGRYVRARAGRLDWLVASAVSLASALLVIQIFSNARLAFTGELNLEIRGQALLSLNADIVWMAAILTVGFFATRASIWKFNRPHGFLTFLLLVLALLAFCGGVLIERPVLLAPEFNTAPDKPATLPWLFVTFGAGAIAGFHLMIIHAVTAKQLHRESDARLIGYGGTLLNAMVALSAVIIAGTTFGAAQPWNEFFASWKGLQNLRPLFQLYIDGFSGFVSAIGLDAAFARTAVTVLVMSLLSTGLEAGLRVQYLLFEEVRDRFQIRVPGGKRFALWLTIGLTAVAAMWHSQTHGGIGYWPYFGAANLILATFGFVLVALTLRHFGYPTIYALVPAGVTSALAAWAILSMLARWWEQNQWLSFVLGLVSSVALAIVLWEILRLYLSPPSPPR